MAMLSKNVKVQTITHEDGTTGLDIRVFRKFAGQRDLKPGKGLRLSYSTPEELASIVADLTADLAREVKRVNRAAKVAAKVAA